MKKFLLLAIIFISSCTDKDYYVEPLVGSYEKFELVNEVNININLTEKTRCLLFDSYPYDEHGRIIIEPIMIDYAPINKSMNIPSSVNSLYLLTYRGLMELPNSDININNISTRANINDGFLVAVNNYYPDEVRNVTEEQTRICSDIIVKDNNTNISLTFIKNGGTIHNDLYYYTYTDENIEPQNITNIFKNSQTIEVGQEFNLGTFDSGIKVGFMLQYNLNEENKSLYTTPILNEKYNDYLFASGVLRKLKYDNEEYITIGFEDLLPDNYYCDRDYNDIICTVTATPSVDLVEDILPPPLDDAKISWGGMWLFEDNYPKKGDYDFNDVVIRYKITEYSDDSPTLLYLQLMACGAGFNNTFGVNDIIYIENIHGYVNVFSSQMNAKVVNDPIEVYLPKTSEYIPFLNNGTETFYLRSLNETNIEYPNVLQIPISSTEMFKWCLEYIRIDEAYPLYMNWVEHGKDSDWYFSSVIDDKVFFY